MFVIIQVYFFIQNNISLFWNIRCTPPHKSTDYQKIYSDWCNEFEKYKSAMKSWEKKQLQCSARQNYSNQHPNDIVSSNVNVWPVGKYLFSF